MVEEWRNIPGYSGYMVSNNGKIKSMNYNNTKKEKIMDPSPWGGYYKVRIPGDNGVYKNFQIHRIVASVFLGDSDLEVNHKDGNKLNNKLDNLEYCTRSENQKHAYKIGLKKAISGSDHYKTKFSDYQVKEIRDYVKEHGRLKNTKKLALKYGVSNSTLYYVAARKNNCWPHIN